MHDNWSNVNMAIQSVDPFLQGPRGAGGWHTLHKQLEEAGGGAIEPPQEAETYQESSTTGPRPARAGQPSAAPLHQPDPTMAHELGRCRPVIAGYQPSMLTAPATCLVYALQQLEGSAKGTLQIHATGKFWRAVCKCCEAMGAAQGNNAAQD